MSRIDLTQESVEFKRTLYHLLSALQTEIYILWLKYYIYIHRNLQKDNNGESERTSENSWEKKN